jgi:hypothetical protein
MKDTEEGEKLTRCINEKENIEIVSNFLTDIVFKNMSVEDIKIFIENAKKEAFEEGKRHKQKELQKVLGII